MCLLRRADYKLLIEVSKRPLNYILHGVYARRKSAVARAGREPGSAARCASGKGTARTESVEALAGGEQGVAQESVGPSDEFARKSHQGVLIRAGQKTHEVIINTSFNNIISSRIRGDFRIL